MLRDLLAAVRFLSKNPLFSFAVVLILALGIGANTAVFTVVDAILIRPLPYQSPERLVRIEEANPKLVIRTIAAPNFLHWANRSDLFEKIAPYSKDVLTLTHPGAPEQVFVERVAPSLFSLLGVHAKFGRELLPSDETSNVAVVSDRFWRRVFNADTHAVGKSITLSDEVRTIAGVMPPEFEFPQTNIDVWMPLHVTPALKSRMDAIARMQPGRTLSGIRSAMDIVARELEQENHTENAGLRIVVSEWRETLERQYELSLILIFGAVGMVLLIACANVGSLLLSRAVQRQKEIAIRAALGAGFWRVLRQLFAESLVLAMAGSLAGVWVAYALLGVLLRQLAALPIIVPHIERVTVNGRVLAFSAGWCLLLAILSSLAPVWLARKTDLQLTLRSGFGGGSAHATRLFPTLIAIEAGFAFLLLVGSGLMLKSLMRLEQADNGFHADHVLTMRVPLGTLTQRPGGKYGSRQQQIGFYREVLDRLERVPGVKAVAVVNNLPLSGSNTLTVYRDIDGSLLPLMTRTISPQYFDVMGTPMLAGRRFNHADTADAPGVAIINQYLAQRFFPDRDPIGRRLPSDEHVNITVVGVVKNSWQASYNEPAKGEIFIPYRQFMFGTFLATIVAKTSGDPLAMADTLRRQVQAVDPEEPVTKVETLDDVITDSIWRPRFSAWTLSALGALALLLTAAGIYAVIAYTTGLRAREVGIRVALGASPGRVAATVLRSAMIPLCIGLAVSFVAAMLLTRFVASLLYETRDSDPATFLGAAVLLIAVGCAASLRPAWKAATADPLEALRTE